MESNMYNNFKILLRKFKEIQKIGIIESLRDGYESIGYTFEKMLGKDEDWSYMPDFLGIEIKTKMANTRNAISLFSMSPKKDNCTYAIKWLVDNFGYISKKNNNIKLFKEDIDAKEWVKIYNNYRIKLKLCKNENRIKLIICDAQNNLTDDSIYWNLSDLKERMEKKLKYLAFITANCYINNRKKYFLYNNIKFYKLKNFNYFIDSIETGKIKVRINVDISHSTKYMGKLHDHGATFRIKKELIEEIFERIYIDE